MKNYYNVSFKIGEFYHANIAHAESMEAADKAYEKYEWHCVSDANDYDVEDAKRKGKPIVEID